MTPASAEPPLYVDLDGTLIAADSLRSAVVGLLTRRPWTLLGPALALTRGRPAFKSAIADRVRIDPASLPYRAQLVEFLRVQAAGRRVVLATAAHEAFARPIAEHLGLFAGVLASSGTVNLKGRRKLLAIQADAAAHGFAGPPPVFDYAGDSRADLPIFAAARGAILVAPGSSVRLAAERTARVLRVFSE
ncbi:MAG: haloacid dehalogenase-like hydrolase [Phycisphaerales bacterium]|nr:haloacid dehalogenase-like hydrolase [Phycisphaerales bacterium]